ncbi:LamG-like jellyroll fold domain-containing protein [Luteococcus peritonei]|uniref:LamG-like jellyroll fold domain-containing protein n=1 Tax=Luteococcus peritonei TaxID=88874 RepID=A0ABW4RXH1_9ACTN
MTSTNRRTFLAIGAAGTAGLAVAATAGCSGDDETSPSPTPSAEASSGAPTTGQGLAKEILADEPLLYLDFQDDADAKAPADRSGHGHKATLHGKQWWANDALLTPAPDAVGRAFYSGSSVEPAWVEVADATTWLGTVASTGLSVEMWMNQEEPNYAQCLLKLDSSTDDTGWSFGFQQEGTGLVAEGPGYKAVESTTPKLPGAWHHVAFTADKAGAVAQYVDGKKVGEGSIGPFVGKVTKVLIGMKKAGEGASLSGQWSHLAIFGKALAPERVAAHHAAGVAEADPAVRGADWWFGGPAYYKQFSNAEVLTDTKRFPVAEWWMNAFDEDLPTEKKYADGAVVVDPQVTPEGLRKAGIWTIRTVGMDMTGKPGAETIGWLPEDEADMATEKMQKMEKAMKQIPDGALAYSNFGTGVTISSIDRYRVRPLVDRPKLHQVSADLYSYCFSPTVCQQVEDAWGIPKEIARRAWIHGKTVERCRAFLTVPRPVWGLVALGHGGVTAPGEPGWSSVPSADEVEGAMMSCILGGASGILLFPQTFPDSKKAPIWNAKTAYKAGDTVRDAKEEHRFWYARTEPKQGVDPNTVTDDSWLSWRPGVFGVRDKDHFARGVSDRVEKVKARLQTHAEVFNSRSQNRRFNDKLYTRWWPSTPDGNSYLLAMQDIHETDGSYDYVMPEGVTEVEVVDEDRTIKVSDGTFTDSFANEWEHHLYRWKV